MRVNENQLEERKSGGEWTLSGVPQGMLCRHSLLALENDPSSILNGADVTMLTFTKEFLLTSAYGFTLTSEVGFWIQLISGDNS